MSRSRDAIVIGAGHNGLVAAAMLAQAGLKPLVVEARGHAGGLLGDPALRIASMPYPLMPEIAARLGVRVEGTPMRTVVLAPGETPVRIANGRAEGASAAQAEAFRNLLARLQRQSAPLRDMALRMPPRFAGMGMRELLALGGTGLRLRRLGKADLRELMRIALSNVHDLIEDEIGDGPLGAALAMDATLGGAMGPRSPGTVLALLYRTAVGGGVRFMPRGGPGALVEALLRVLRERGGEIVTGAPVERILVEGDRAAGVRLAGGEEIRAPLVMSSAAPGTTLLRLLGPEHLDAEFVRRCRNMASRGMTARIDFELSGDPFLADGTVPGPADRLVLASSSRALEQAFDAAKHGRIPGNLPLEAHWSARDSRLSVTAQFAPHEPEGGWNAASETALRQAVADVVSQAIPGFAALVHASAVMTPASIGSAYAIPGGHWHHGELRIDQLMMLRPFDGAAGYAMPVTGLYLCGAGSHPGGDIGGAAGFNAANAALSGRKR